MAFLTKPIKITKFYTDFRGMEFYINELSLHGQYTNAHDAVAALTTYNQLLSLLHDTQTAAFYHPDFLFHFDRKTLQTEAFQITLDRNPRIGAGFRALVARKLQAKDWRETRVHTDDTFYYHQKESHYCCYYQ